MAESARELGDEARALMLDGIGKWIDQWDWTAGSVVTGWVVVAETVRPDGTTDVTWTGGDGSATANDSGGIPIHRADALVRYAGRSIDTALVDRLRGTD